MDPTGINVTVNCRHHHHLFKSPLCSKLTTQQKVGNVFFHIFTFALPLLGYKIYTAIKRSQIRPSPSGIESNSPRLSFNQHFIDSTKPVQSRRLSEDAVEQSTDLIEISPSEIDSADEFRLPPYSIKGQEAIDFAYALLTKENVPPADISKLQPPVNNQLSLIFNLFYKKQEEWKKTLGQYKEDTWNHPEVIKAADEMLKLAFTASCLTLEDAKELNKQMGVIRSPAEALTKPDTYMYKAYFMLTTSYHLVRAGLCWNLERNNLNYPKNIPEDHAKKFYQSGTINNEWNQLYNEFCERVDQFAGLQNLKAYDERFYKWSQSDLDPTKFVGYPSKIPS